MPILLPKTTHFDRFSHARCVASTTRIIQNIWFLALSSEPLQYSSPPGPTPAVWPKGGTLSSIGGPCLSEASWPALLKLASVLSHEARWGVSGFRSFCRNKRASPAGAKPGFTENHIDLRVGDTRAMRSPASAFSTGKTQDEFPLHIV